MIGMEENKFFSSELKFILISIQCMTEIKNSYKELLANLPTNRIFKSNNNNLKMR